jgi:hypothetical protein
VVDRVEADFLSEQADEDRRDGLGQGASGDRVEHVGEAGDAQVDQRFEADGGSVAVNAAQPAAG